MSDYELDYLQVSTGTSTTPTATVRLKRDGKTMRDSSCGDGPIDAVFKSIDRITRTRGRLDDYQLKKRINGGSDAVGEANVIVIFRKRRFSAKFASRDVIEASAKAYLLCVNCYLSKLRERRANKTCR